MSNLTYLKSQVNEGETINSINTFFYSITNKLWFGWGSKLENVKKMSDVLEHYQNVEGFDILLQALLEKCLDNYLRNGEQAGLDFLFQRYSDNPLVKNLTKLLNEKKVGDIREYNSGSRLTLENYRLLIQCGKDLKLWFWSWNYDELFDHSIAFKSISTYLKSLKSSFSESDIKNIERSIYFILGPRKDAYAIFIKAYEDGHLFNFFGWEGFPLTNVNSNPRQLSKVLVQYGTRCLYLGHREKEIKKRIKLKAFANKQVCPPARLLVYHLLNKPYTKKLLRESILYFQDCSADEKKGAFSILYKLLNPFELT